MKRAKYGRGLNREIVAAVNSGTISEPFSIDDVRNLIADRGWEVPETYLRVCLANGASNQHSLTYQKYFVSMGQGKYRLSGKYKGPQWI